MCIRDRCRVDAQRGFCGLTSVGNDTDEEQLCCVAMVNQQGLVIKTRQVLEFERSFPTNERLGIETSIDAVEILSM